MKEDLLEKRFRTIKVYCSTVEPAKVLIMDRTEKPTSQIDITSLIQGQNAQKGSRPDRTIEVLFSTGSQKF